MNLLNQIKYLEEFDLPLMFSGAVVPSPLVLDDVISCIVRRCGLLEPRYTEPDVMRKLTTLWFRTNQWNFTHLVNIILAEYSPIENTDRYSEHTTEHDDSGTVTAGGSDTRSQTEGGTDTVTTQEDIAGTSGETHGGTDRRTVTNGGSDTTSATATRAAFNSSVYDPYDKTDTTQTYGGNSTEAMAHGETITGSESTDRDQTEQTAYGHTLQDVTQYGRTETRSGTGSESYTEHTHGNIGVTTNQDMINQELALLEKFNIYDWIAAKFEREMCLQIY